MENRNKFIIKNFKKGFEVQSKGIDLHINSPLTTYFPKWSQSKRGDVNNFATYAF